MWFPGEQDIPADEDLLDFLLKDDVPCPAILREENTVLENSDLPELELMDKDIDDLINSLLDPFEDKPGMLQDYLLPTSDSSISEYQHPSPSPGSAFASSLESSDIVQADHNYSLNQGCLEMENMRSEMGGGHAFTDLGTWMDLEDGSKALEVNSVFPVAVDANPQLVPGAAMQPCFPGLSEEERQLLVKEGTSLPACQPLMNVNPCCSLSLPSGPGPLECFSQSRGSKIQNGSLAEERYVKTVRWKTRNKQPAQESRNKQPAQERRNKSRNKQPAQERRNKQPAQERRNKQPAQESRNKQPAQERRNKQPAQESRNKQPAQESRPRRRRRKKSYLEDLEHRMAACMAQNHKLEKKVRVLQKRNMSLLKQVEKLQALGRQSNARTATGESSNSVMVLSFYFILSPSVPSSGSQETLVKIRVQSRQIRKLPNQAAPAVQEAMVEGCSLEPHNLSLLGSLNQP